MYRYSFISIPWDVGPREELVALVESGRVKPCRAIDLGSGTASNVVFLAQHGFEVTGVDYIHAAIEMGQERAQQAGVDVTFIQDDLTNLQNINGTYDLLVDYGTLDDLKLPQRDLYIKNVLPLTHPDSLFLLYCFEWVPGLLGTLFYKRGGIAMEQGEIERLFGKHFSIEVFSTMEDGPQYGLTWITYLMTRK